MILQSVFLLASSALFLPNEKLEVVSISRDFNYFIVQRATPAGAIHRGDLELWNAKKRLFGFKGEAASFVYRKGKTLLVAARITGNDKEELVVSVRDLKNTVLSEKRINTDELCIIDGLYSGPYVSAVMANSGGRFLVQIRDHVFLEFAMESDTYDTIFVFGEQVVCYSKQEAKSLTYDAKSRLEKLGGQFAGMTIDSIQNTWVFNFQLSFLWEDLGETGAYLGQVDYWNAENEAVFAAVTMSDGGPEFIHIAKPRFAKNDANFIKPVAITRNEEFNQLHVLNMQLKSDKEITVSLNKIEGKETKKIAISDQSLGSLKIEKGRRFLYLEQSVRASTDGKYFFAIVATVEIADGTAEKKKSPRYTLYRISEKSKIEKVIDFDSSFQTVWDDLHVLEDRIVLLNNETGDHRYYLFENFQPKRFRLGR